jgi:hypothetical protein
MARAIESHDNLCLRNSGKGNKYAGVYGLSLIEKAQVQKM